jgi:hypothetical protein
LASKNSIFGCREKAKLKQLTLEISERQEEEELNEALAHLQRSDILPHLFYPVIFNYACP